MENYGNKKIPIEKSIRIDLQFKKKKNIRRRLLKTSRKDLPSIKI